MQFEEFDKKVQEAASHHHPAYDEKAWGKMEQLLDKHLPQKEKKRRRFFYLLLLLAGLGTAGILLLQPGSKRMAPPVAVTRELKPFAEVNPGKQKNEVLQEPVAQRVSPSLPKISREEEVVSGIPVKRHPSGNRIVITKGNDPFSQTLLPNSGRTGPELNEASKGSKPGNEKVASGREEINAAEPVAKISLRDSMSNTVPRTDQQKVAAENTSNPAMTGTVPPVAGKEEKTVALQQGQENPAVKKAQPLKRSSQLFLAVSAGPDVSFTAGGKPGVTRISGGFGIGYTYKDRFTLRTGVYEGRKIYKAAPDAYNAPALFYVYYPYLERVWANCRIREIPINLSYHFGKSSGRDWMVTAGLSSLLMKEEVYDYTYKRTANGPLLYRRWSVIDQGKHLFSVLTVGAGYRRTLGKRVTVLAEPYLKVPLSGVGYGKVKLFSSGISFSVAVNPFTPKLLK